MKRPYLIFGAGIVLVGILYFFVVFQPQGNHISQTTDEAVAAEIRRTQMEADLKHLQELQQNAPKLREQANILDEAMPNDPQLAKFIRQVQDAADGSGIEFLSIAPTPPTQSPDQPEVKLVAITMSISGGYFAVQDFIVRLETLSRAVKVGSINLSLGDAVSSSSSPPLKVSLTMQMFVANPNPVPATVPGVTTTAGA
ncbi:MAG TPA: type 4a pilus biogenesis protein PilO [Actinomycetota bacterium]|nr:type 4a pilus biogenesis protein PilO [Actinomycetota bacterium]